VLLALPTYIQLGCKMLAIDKRSNLLRKYVNYGRKEFCNIVPRFTMGPSVASALGVNGMGPHYPVTRCQLRKHFTLITYESKK
jgi:hypothetical protein